MSVKMVIRAAALLAGLLAAQAQAGMRTLETRYGPVTLDGEVSRVVTLYEGALDSSVAVGVTPVGAVATRGSQGVAAYMQDKVGELAMVATARETNLEAVIALQPDLILASSSLPEEQYRLLSAVAPTLVPAIEGLDPDAWKQEARLYGQALEREEQMERVLTGVEQRAAELRQRVQQLPAGDRQAVLARWMPQGPIMMSTRLFSTGLLAATGFEVQDAGIVKADRPHSAPLSLENLSLMDEDWIFMATLNQDGRDAMAAAERSPAFARLSAVERNRVMPVDGQVWTSASGPLAAHVMLDDIERMLERATD